MKKNYLERMIECAIEARDNAYAPYSNHPVGASIRTPDGTIYAGTNVENAAYPQGTCAETTAIGGMILAGGTKTIETVVVVGPSMQLCTPCGGCRQKIREFGTPNTEIYVCDKNGEVMLETSLKDLLPHSFGPENVEKNQKNS